MYFFNNKGQSFLEGLVVAIIITVFMFAAIQVCIITTDDMFANYVSFYATRKIVVTPTKDIFDKSKQVVSKFFVPYILTSKSYMDYKTTHWDEDILGKNNKDHAGKDIKKHNVKIGYYTKIMFYRLFSSLPYRNQSARARMIKSPDEQFYSRAYPNAKEFPKIK